MKTLFLAGATVAALAAANLVPAMAQATKPVSQVVQWNQTLLVIVSTPSTALTSLTWFALGHLISPPKRQRRLQQHTKSY
jgi:hypothetical protein